MKAIAINGSPRKNWNTDMLIQQALKGAKDAGAMKRIDDISEYYASCDTIQFDDYSKYSVSDKYHQKRKSTYQKFIISRATPMLKALLIYKIILKF